MDDYEETVEEISTETGDLACQTQENITELLQFHN